MSKIPVILDCDPGHDDAIGIILACASEKLDVKAITTVGGNQTIKKTTNNALRVLNFINKDIPVAMGANKPMRRDLEIAEEVHGDSGLEGPILPDSDKEPENLSAVELISKVVSESKKKVIIIPTGPLTNIAIFLLAYPNLHSKIECISLMGGAAKGGNWTASAEFNILVDPEAADIVFKSGIPITMAGLDVTHKAQIRNNDINRIKNQGGKVAIMVGELLEYFSKFHKEICGWDFAPLHDPCAVAWVIKPEMFKSKKLNVCIDIEGEYTTGCTVTDFLGVTGRKPNVNVLLDVDTNQFIELIIESVNKY